MNKSIKLLSIKLLLIFLSLSLLFVFSACGKKPEKKLMTPYKKKEKAPQKLNKIYDDTSSILKDIEKINKISIESEKKAKIVQDEIKSKQSNRKEEKLKEEKIIEMWENINKNIKNIHSDWNSYETEGKKKVGDTSDIDKVEESLNDFAVAIENMDHLNILNEGSKVFLNLSPFFDVYKDEIKGNTCRIKYYTYQSYIVADKGKIDKANWYILQAEGHLNNIRQKIGDDKGKLKTLEKLTLSLGDMKNVMKKESSSLFKIKRDIVLNNIEKLEE